MSNPWLLHVKEFRKEHPELSYKEALQQASKTYTKKSSKKTKEGETKVEEKKPKEKSKSSWLWSELYNYGVNELLQYGLNSFEITNPVLRTLFKKLGRRAIDFATTKRSPDKLPPKVVKMLKSIGDENITSLKVFRTPLTNYVSFAMNLISLNQFKKLLEESPYDAFFHVGILINDEYVLEKNEEISLLKKKLSDQTQFLDIPLKKKKLTIKQLIETAQKSTPPERFSWYDPKDANCQVFVEDVLKAQKLWTNPIQSWVKQDLVSVFNKMPKATHTLAKSIVDIAGQISKILQGGKLQKKKLPSKK